MQNAPLTMIVCASGQDSRAMEQARLCANRDGLCTVVQIDPGGRHPANLAAMTADGPVLLLAPGALPDARTIADARRALAEGEHHAILGSGYFTHDGSIAEAADLELAYRHALIAQKQGLPLDASCAVFSGGSFAAVAGGIDICAADAIHELACALTALGRGAAFDPRLRARFSPPWTWKDLARAFFDQGAQLVRRLAGVSGLDLPKRPWLPSAAWEGMLVLAAAGFAGLAAWHDTMGNLIRALICMLLLYPVNRVFLKQVSETSPELMNSVMLLCLLRAPSRTAGMLWGALRRLAGQRGTQ